MSKNLEIVMIRGEYIELGKLLKFAGLADTGGEARSILETGEVSVNGKVERRRGAKIRDNDVVCVEKPPKLMKIKTNTS